MATKKFRLSPYEWAMFAVVVMAILLRLLLIRLNWPVTDSDEGTMGLMASHIAYQHEHPTFFYGQYYMAPIEAYIGAPLFRLFGISAFTLRLGLLPFFAAFLVCMFYLTRLLYTERFALVSVVLLSLGSSYMIRHQLLALGGYPEIMLYGGLLLLLAVWLTRTYKPSDRDVQHATAVQSLTRAHWRRWLLYGAWGFVTGIALWTDQLILPIVFVTGCLLLFFCWRELLSWAGVCMLAGLVVGALPMIIYNATAPLDRSFFGVLLYLHRTGADEVAAKHITSLQKFAGVFLVSIPVATGAHQLCELPDTFYSVTYFGAAHPLSCAVLNGIWSTGLVILWAIALLLAVQAFQQIITRRCRSCACPADPCAPNEPLTGAQGPTGQAQDLHLPAGPHTSRGRNQSWQSPVTALSGGSHSASQSRSAIMMKEEVHEAPQADMFAVRQEAIRQVGRLMLLLSAVISLLLFATSSAAALYPLTASRYLICMLFATPAVLWPLWSWEGWRSWHASTIKVMRTAILLLVFVTFVVGTIFTLLGVPRAEAAYAQEDALIHHLVDSGATRIYTDYWTCNRTIFQSNEHIICAVVNDDLSLGYNRYDPYLSTVQATTHPAYVSALHMPLAAALAHKYGNDMHYKRSEFGGYVIYQYQS